MRELPRGSVVVELEQNVSFKFQSIMFLFFLLILLLLTNKHTGFLIAVHQVTSSTVEPPSFAGGRQGAVGGAGFPPNCAFGVSCLSGMKTEV